MRTISSVNPYRWRIVLLLAILAIVSVHSFADSQFDITLSWPYFTGLKYAGGEFGTFSEYLIIVPDVQWHWYFGSDVLHFGIGLELYTLIIESLVYPHIALESVLGDFVLTAGVGGGVFLVFGLYNAIEAGAVFIPEVSAAYRLGRKKIFSLGTKAMFIIAPEVADLNNFVFVGTVFGRFSL